jgi:ubiquinone biosynthesis protein COQ4
MYLQLSPRRALEAARKIAEDPDDLPQVFTLIESLSADTLHRMARRFAESEGGRRLLDGRPDIVERLADRAALARLPANSLGRAYLAFVESENISAEGIRDAAEKGKKNADALPRPLDYVSARMRDTHDLWHAAVGYRGDVLGEASLLAFTLAQTWNPAIALLVAIGWYKTGEAHPRKTIVDGFRRGRDAAWLPAQEWETLLELPLEDVRRRLRLGPPALYTPMRTVDLKALHAL